MGGLAEGRMRGQYYDYNNFIRRFNPRPAIAAAELYILAYPISAYPRHVARDCKIVSQARYLQLHFMQVDKCNQDANDSREDSRLRLHTPWNQCTSIANQCTVSMCPLVPIPRHGLEVFIYGRGGKTYPHLFSKFTYFCEWSRRHQRIRARCRKLRSMFPKIPG